MEVEYELISAEEYANLPEDDDQCFVEFEAICRRNMIKMTDGKKDQYFDRTVCAQYMAAVASVAAECRVPNIIVPINDLDSDGFYSEFRQFILSVQGEVARIRIRGRRNNPPFSVRLTDNTRTKIEHYISRLRDAINSSDMDQTRRQKLHEKLDQLTSELDASRLSFAKTMALLAAVLAGLSGVVTIAADAPDAVTNIMKLIGQDKESEDAAALRLAPPPPKALPAPVPKPARPSVVDELDDDIPF